MVQMSIVPTGFPYKKSKTRVLVNADQFLLHMVKKMRDREINIWDVHDRHILVVGEADAFCVHFEDAKYRVPHDEACEVFDGFLKGGALDSSNKRDNG